jgi:hypothetical protein
VRLIQDAGTELESSGLVAISPFGQYALSAPSSSSRPSAFVKSPSGIVEFELGQRSSGQIRLGPGSTMTAAGGIAASHRGFDPRKGDRYEVVTSTGGLLRGAFTSGIDGFLVLTPDPNAISLAFGQVATHATGGRLAISLTDACPPGTYACYLRVRATAKQRISTWRGKGAMRRRHTRAVTTTVANVGRYLKPGETRVITVRLNARGRALVARTGHAHAIVVTAVSDNRTILHASVQVRP